MAEFWSNNDRGYRIRLWIDQTSQDIPGNSSQVRVRLALLNTTTTFAQYNCSAWVDLNGQRLNWSGSPNMASYNSTIMLIDQTITVGHNEDGTKSFGFSASFSGSGGWSPRTLSIGGNLFTLTTIPRSSSVSVGAATIGSSVAINISRQNSSFKHTVRYAWGNKSGTIASNVDTSTTWTIPLDFANDIPDSNSGWGTIYCDTYSGLTKIGTSSTTFTATLSGNVKPYFSGITLTDANSATQNLIPQQSHFVSVLSQIRVTFNDARGVNGSKITGYYAEIAGENQSINSNNGIFQPVATQKDKQITIRARVSDSRNQWSDWKETKVTILYYFNPVLRFDVSRSGAQADTFTIKRWAKVAPLTVGGLQKNTLKLTFRVAQIGKNNYENDTGPASGEWTSVSTFDHSAANLSKSYTADKSFVVIGRIEDKFTYAEFQVTVGTQRIVYSYDREGLGIGKYRERGALDVNGFIYANNKQIQHHKLTESDGTVIADNFTTDLNNYLTSGYYQTIHTVKNYPIQSATGKDQTGVLEVMSGPFGIQQTLSTMSGRVFRRSILGQFVGDWIEYQSVRPAIEKDIALPYGMEGRLVRKGDVVTLSIKRKTVSIGSHENAKANESISSGYRPTVDSHLLVALNNLNSVKGTAIVTIAKSGELYLTNDIRMTCVTTGTITYLTSDPYPL